MKSKVNLALMALGFCVIAATEANVSSMESDNASMVTESRLLPSDGSNIDSLPYLQSNQYAIIQPCYRWPHPCD